jgi:hypothetical protein
MLVINFKWGLGGCSAGVWKLFITSCTDRKNEHLNILVQTQTPTKSVLTRGGVLYSPPGALPRFLNDAFTRSLIYRNRRQWVSI